ncbi:hypothetical protein HYX03_01455 [Candidatus Woesearchaeota archaeon]|nr:hypothetical protein [Candidatus Woesearchaeota archaeon]
MSSEAINSIYKLKIIVKITPNPNIYISGSLGFWGMFRKSIYIKNKSGVKLTLTTIIIILFVIIAIIFFGGAVAEAARRIFG